MNAIPPGAPEGANVRTSIAGSVVQELAHEISCAVHRATTEAGVPDTHHGTLLLASAMGLVANAYCKCMTRAQAAEAVGVFLQTYNLRIKTPGQLRD